MSGIYGKHHGIPVTFEQFSENQSKASREMKKLEGEVKYVFGLHDYIRDSFDTDKSLAKLISIFSRVVFDTTTKDGDVGILFKALLDAYKEYNFMMYYDVPFTKSEATHLIASISKVLKTLTKDYLLVPNQNANDIKKYFFTLNKPPHKFYDWYLRNYRAYTAEGAEPHSYWVSVKDLQKRYILGGFRVSPIDGMVTHMTGMKRHKVTPYVDTTVHDVPKPYNDADMSDIGSLHRKMQSSTMTGERITNLKLSKLELKKIVLGYIKKSRNPDSETLRKLKAYKPKFDMAINQLSKMGESRFAKENAKKIKRISKNWR
jgi:hypothetical protein